MTRIAVMQPYVFPYIGYFQLMAGVDRFWLLDDVTFIKKGWINRNRILLNGSPFTFSIPVQKASQNRKICDTRLSDISWRQPLLQTFRHAYTKAPYFDQWFPRLRDVVELRVESVAELARNSINEVCDYLGIEMPRINSTSTLSNSDLTGSERILEICRSENADVYLNLPGGRSLYRSQDFANAGIDLRFLSPPDVTYKQFQHEFLPDLSIIDLLMFNSAEQARLLISQLQVDEEIRPVSDHR